MKQLEELQKQIDNERVEPGVCPEQSAPIRGEAFTTDFKGAAVETDCHASLTATPPKARATVTRHDRCWRTDSSPRRTTKLGLSLGGYRDEFPNHVGEAA
jgi:hypothetical protein